MTHPWRPAGRRKNAGVNYPSVSLAVPLPHPGGRLWGRTVCGFSPFRVEKLREAVMRGCAASAIHDRRSIHARSAIHPRKAFRFSAYTPHPARFAIHLPHIRGKAFGTRHSCQRTVGADMICPPRNMRTNHRSALPPACHPEERSDEGSFKILRLRSE